MKWFFHGALGFVAILFFNGVEIVSAQNSPEAPKTEETPTLSSLKLEFDVRRADLLKPQRELQANYEKQLNSLMDQVTEAEDLDKALAVKTELAGFRKGGTKVAGDEFPELKRLQKIYAKTSAERADTLHEKLRPLVEGYRAQLVALQQQLTRDKNLEEAVKARELVSKADEMLKTLASSGSSGNRRLDSANLRNAFENGLGMKFVPVPITGGPTGKRQILFSIWEVRVRDYEAFVRSAKRTWAKSGFKESGENYPAVLISWEEAKAFCEWLTEKERDAGKIGLKDRYRLPTDHEWSCAIGIGPDEDPEVSPRIKHLKISDVFLWGGKEWPPPEGSGNFWGEETNTEPVRGRDPIVGYYDGFVNTAPVGTFPANPFGLYDLNGNVSEWCEDVLDPTNPVVSRVARGGCWFWQNKDRLSASYRIGDSPKSRSRGIGIRCVLEMASGI